MRNFRNRLAAVGLLVLVLALGFAPAAMAQSMPTGTDTSCDDPGTTGTVEKCSIGDSFQSAVSDFGTLVVDLAPYLFAGLITVLLIRLAIKWFRRVAKSV